MYYKNVMLMFYYGNNIHYGRKDVKAMNKRRLVGFSPKKYNKIVNKVCGESTLIYLEPGFFVTKKICSKKKVMS